MPSIYNHENACWGIRRSSCDVFQFDLNEEFKIDKSGNRDYQSNNTFVQYSVSSNGYYGYQPHKAIQLGQAMANTEVEMEIEDVSISTNSNISPINDSASMRLPGCAMLNTDLQVNNVSRKRQMSCESVEGTKRFRQEEAETHVKPPVQESHRREYYSHTKCLMAHFV